MLDFFKKLFNSSDFMPHGHCYFWQSDVLWMHVAGDTLTFIAYLLIPLGLIMFIQKRADLQFKGIFFLFGAFILFCGITHFIDIWTIWVPFYRLEAIMKLFTGLVSIATAITLFKLIPQLLRIPGISEMAQANETLSQQRYLLESGEKAAKFGTFVFDYESQKVDFSNGLLEVYEFDKTKISDSNFMEKFFSILYKEDISKVKKAGAENNQPGETQELDFRIVMKDGRIKWLRSISINSEDAKGSMGTVQDITVEKLNAEKLKALNENLEKLVKERTDKLEATQRQVQLMFDTAPEMMVSVDVKAGTYIRVNDTMVNRLGYAREELIGKSVLDFYEKEDHEKLENAWKKLSNQESVKGIPLHMRTKSGEILDIELNATAVYIEENNVIGTSSILRDKTEENKMQKALKESESRFRTMADNAPLGIALVDLEGIPFYNNNRFEQIMGYSREEVSKMSFGDFTHPDDIEKDWALYNELQGKKRDVYQIEKRYIKKSGEEVSVSLSVSMVRDANGNNVHAVAAVEDISEKNKRKQLLEEQARMISRGEEVGNLGMVIMNRNPQEIISYSQNMPILYGFGPGEISPENFLERIESRFYAEDIKITKEFYKPLLEKRPDPDHVLEHRILLPNGEVKWVSVKADIYMDEQHTILVVRDITREKEAEQELLATQKELESFIYSVSHDLRAPIRHIQGFASMVLETDEEHLSEEGIGYLGRVDTAAQRLGNMIDELLSYSRSRNAQVSKVNIDLNELVTDCMDAFIKETKENKITWKKDNLPVIFGDREMITKVFDNFLSNAVKFTGKTPNPEIEIGFQDKKNKFLIWVKDNGVGFNMDYKDKLFAVFQRLHKKSQFNGTGIGLANVNRIIQLHQGEVWGEGTPGEGAIFYFTIPKKKK